VGGARRRFSAILTTASFQSGAGNWLKGKNVLLLLGCLEMTEDTRRLSGGIVVADPFPN